MAKAVTFKAQDVLGKDFTIVDTFSNIKKIDAGMENIFSAIDKVDKEKGDNATFMQYNDAISEQVIIETGKLLDLTKTDTKKLESMPYSDVFAFYSEAVDKFLGMEVPSVQKMQQRIKKVTEQIDQPEEEENKGEDPKSSEEG
ncbi:hypothetical protein [Limosilactobacillus mucosae]|uniref:Uncharacterized protein n=1 Tax=Limosilactobacillus mucosae TaxID=97478 RepID=A0A508YN52_LIMMU|nr:hypothetical protein [Limosilactobacillus mucosae]VTZ91478.1 hypothetical protein LMUP508_01446 [Limosilactobacillus mucosae]